MKKDFGQWLRANRRRLGLSQEEVGESIGRTKGYISTLERNYSASKSGDPVRPDVKDVEKLARVLRVPINEARDMAGYALTGSDTFTTDDRLIEYYSALPSSVQGDVLAIVETLYRRHAGEQLHTVRIPEMNQKLNESERKKELKKKAG